MARELLELRGLSDLLDMMHSDQLGEKVSKRDLGSTKEREAEQLALDLLMPRALIGKLRSSGTTDPQELAEHFNVPPGVMKKRLGIKD